jgi:RND family efflux transporter MFP subunit
MRLKIALPLAVAIAAVLVTISLLATSARVQPAQPEAILTAVRVTEVTPERVRMVVHSQGTAAPRTESDLVPEVAGKVMWISPRLVAGGAFPAGELLLRIDERDYAAAAGRARAALQRAGAESEHARFELRRLEQLESRQLASRSQMENALRVARIANADLDDARFALERAELDQERTSLHAPFSGLVRSKDVDVGQFVSRGTAIATLYASDLVEVRLPIADEQLAYLNIPLSHTGEFEQSTAPKATLRALYGGREHEWDARIVRTEAEIDAQSRMVHLVARVNNAGVRAESAPPLRVGQFVRADIEGRSADHIVVLPRSAIRNDNRVLIVDEQDRLQYREVDLLRVYRDKAYITAGLAAGERVCVSPLQTVVEGMRVRPRSEATEAS